MTLEELRKVAEPLCREFGVKRLDAFGSVARGSAGPASDVDLLVEFAEPEHTPAKRFFGLLHRLEDTLGCSVDLLTLRGSAQPAFQGARTEREGAGL